MGIEAKRIEAVATGELDLRGTLGVSREERVGLEEIRLELEVEAPGANREEIEALRSKTERYCTVLQTLRDPPPIGVSSQGEERSALLSPGRSPARG